MSDLKILVNDNVYLLDKSFVFNGGEVQIRLPPTMDVKDGDVITVKTRLVSSDAIMELRLTKDALDHYFGGHKIDLVVHYMPYARQDRRCYIGEAFGSEVMCSMLVGMNFDTVVYADLHSDQGLPVNFKEISQLHILIGNPQIFEGIDYIVSPDKGATKKAQSVADHYGLPVVQADKIRNPDTGVIEGISINSDVSLQGKSLLVVDDLIDGGYTFIVLANAIHKLYPDVKLSLYVTHGIFSKGIDDLVDSGYNTIYTTDSFRDSSKFDDGINVIRL